MLLAKHNVDRVLESPSSSQEPSRMRRRDYHYPCPHAEMKKYSIVGANAAGSYSSMSAAKWANFKCHNINLRISAPTCKQSQVYIIHSKVQSAGQLFYIRTESNCLRSFFAGHRASWPQTGSHFWRHVGPNVAALPHIDFTARFQEFSNLVL